MNRKDNCDLSATEDIRRSAEFPAYFDGVLCSDCELVVSPAISVEKSYSAEAPLGRCASTGSVTNKE